MSFYHDPYESGEESDEDYEPNYEDGPEDDDDYGDEPEGLFDEEHDGLGPQDFADPGGNSALRASSRRNPRNLPCPNCKRPNMLTPKDKALGYQCDRCADAAERGVDSYSY